MKINVVDYQPSEYVILYDKLMAEIVVRRFAGQLSGADLQQVRAIRVAKGEVSAAEVLE